MNKIEYLHGLGKSTTENGLIIGNAFKSIEIKVKGGENYGYK